MNARSARVCRLGRAVVREARAEKITFMAGSIAYHAFVSVLPLLLLLLAAVAAVGNRTLEAAIIDLTRAVLTPGASEALVAELQTASRSTGLSVFGLAVLLWGTLRIFRGLDTAFSSVYESETTNTFLDQLLDSLFVLVTFALAVLAVGALERYLPPNEGPLTWLLSRVALAVGLAVIFYPMYYVFPDSDVTPAEVVPGVLVAAVGLVTFESLFRLYIRFSARRPTQSVVAGILVFLTFLYVSGLVILLGAVVNAVLSNRSRDVDVRPVFGGIARSRRSDPARHTEVATALERLERLLDGAEAVSLSVDGETVAIPAPDGVETDTEGSRFLAGGDASVRLRWSTREE